MLQIWHEHRNVSLRHAMELARDSKNLIWWTFDSIPRIGYNLKISIPQNAENVKVSVLKSDIFAFPDNPNSNFAITVTWQIPGSKWIHSASDIGKNWQDIEREFPQFTTTIGDMYVL